MRRGLAALFFFIAAVCLALAAGGWWLQRVVFAEDLSADIVDVVMDDSAIRAEIARISANATAATVGIPPLELRTHIETFLQADNPEIRAALETVLADSHARIIGRRDEPVQITGPQLVPIVRDERVALLPPVTLPVDEFAALNVIRIGLDWFVPAAAIAGGVALLLGLVAHPRRADAVYGIGVFCLLGGRRRPRPRLSPARVHRARAQRQHLARPGPGHRQERIAPHPRLRGRPRRRRARADGGLGRHRPPAAVVGQADRRPPSRRPAPLVVIGGV